MPSHLQGKTACPDARWVTGQNIAAGVASSDPGYCREGLPACWGAQLRRWRSMSVRSFRINVSDAVLDDLRAPRTA